MTPPLNGSLGSHPRRARASRAPRPRPTRHHRWRGSILLAAGLGLGFAGSALASYLYIAADLPSLANLRSGQLPQITKIYDQRGPSGGTLLEEVYNERRIVVPLRQVAPYVTQATISIEDRSFYSHHGVSAFRILGAAIHDLGHADSIQGASTIDEQVIKLAFGDRRRSFANKIREALLALQLERIYSKDQILEYYLNKIYYGNQAYGIEAAAEAYFGVPAAELDLAQASLLAGLPQRPATFDPLLDDGYPLARARQAEVLAAMVRDHHITQAESDIAYGEDLRAELATAAARARLQRHSVAPHFVDYVKRYLEDRYGAEQVSLGGLVVTTTLDLTAQREAEAVVQRDVPALGHNVNNAAMLAVDPRSGAIRAMVGSAGYANDAIAGQVNMVTSPRQPGSSFKPYLYAAALEQGPWTPDSTLYDGGGSIGGINFHDWDGRELGAISLRASLQLSRNISSVHLMQKVGFDPVFDLARRVGLTTPLKRELGTALGSSELRMLDHVNGYSAFANGGNRVDPTPLLEVRDAGGEVLDHLSSQPSTRRVLPPMVAYQVTDILKGAVNRSWGLDFPVAGKSGTTNDFVDSWYVGYSTDLAWSAWVGHTEKGRWLAPLDGIYGETGAGILWKDFARAYYLDHPRPVDWKKPTASQRVLVCADGRRADHVVDGQTHYAWVDPSASPGELCFPGSADAASPAPSPDGGGDQHGWSPAPVFSPPVVIEAASPYPSPQTLPSIPIHR